MSIGLSKVRLLGVGGSSHDFSAAVVTDGVIEVAIEDERLDRVRHGLNAWHNDPTTRSVRYCLDALGLELSDFHALYANHDLESNSTFLDSGIEIRQVSHHLAHAAASFFPSPYENAAILVIDGHGGTVANSAAKVELETISLGIGEGSAISLELLQSGAKRLTSGTWHYITSNSLGSFYKIVTDAIGFGMRGQGKTMGLAPYGDSDLFYRQLSGFVSVSTEGGFLFDPYSGIYDWLTDKMSTCGNPLKIRADIAAATQRIFEESILAVAQKCYDLTGLKTLCYGGGCALNGSANYRILRDTPFEEIFIYPAAGDSGLAVGAACIGYFHDFKGKRQPQPVRGLGAIGYTGRNYTKQECKGALDSFPVFYKETANLVSDVARRLLRSEVVGVFRGSSEIGPRALGNRSLLADPRSIAIRDHINLNVKGRESFRPLAPVVPIECAAEYFELSQPSPFMLLIARVRDIYRNALPGICHVDDTARVQTVDKESNPFLYNLLYQYGELTGIPILINTSFNGRGEPIVETPEHALRCFIQNPIDSLVLEDFIVEKHTPWSDRRMVFDRL